MPNIKGAVEQVGKKAGETFLGCIVKVVVLGVAATAMGGLIMLALMSDEGGWQIITIPVDSEPSKDGEPPADNNLPQMIEKLEDAQTDEERICIINELAIQAEKKWRFESGECPPPNHELACDPDGNIVPVPRPFEENPHARVDWACWEVPGQEELYKELHPNE